LPPSTRAAAWLPIRQCLSVVQATALERCADRNGLRAEVCKQQRRAPRTRAGHGKHRRLVGRDHVLVALAQLEALATQCQQPLVVTEQGARVAQLLGNGDAIVVTAVALVPPRPRVAIPGGCAGAAQRRVPAKGFAIGYVVAIREAAIAAFAPHPELLAVVKQRRPLEQHIQCGGQSLLGGVAADFGGEAVGVVVFDEDQLALARRSFRRGVLDRLGHGIAIERDDRGPQREGVDQVDIAALQEVIAEAPVRLFGNDGQGGVECAQFCELRRPEAGQEVGQFSALVQIVHHVIDAKSIDAGCELPVVEGIHPICEHAFEVALHGG